MRMVMVAISNKNKQSCLAAAAGRRAEGLTRWRGETELAAKTIDRSPEDVPAAVEPRRGLQEAVLRPRVPVRRPRGRRRRLHLHQVLHLLRRDRRKGQREESRVPIPLPRGLSKMCMLLRSNAPRPSSPLRYVRAER